MGQLDQPGEVDHQCMRCGGRHHYAHVCLRPPNDACSRSACRAYGTGCLFPGECGVA